MAATESQASWHPAFMPNSISNEPSESLYRYPYANRDSDDSSTTHTKPLRDVSELESHYVTEPKEHIIIKNYEPGANDQPKVEDNEEHPELDHLRSALTKSLASPGGVEMDENPTHADSKVYGDTYSNLDDPTGALKSQFPSERPARESGHASSASFARTVPRDMDWGEDDEVDPEWNLNRTETDPFKLMAKSERTNSFPQVPPSHNPANSAFEHALPQSQAGEIVSRAEQAQKSFEVDPSEGSFGHTTGGDVSSHTDISAVENWISEEPTKERDYGLVYSSEIPDEPETESRYEEGVPLMEDSESSKWHATSSTDAGLGIFGENNAGDDDFLGELAGPGESRHQPHLGRKSTMQVIDALSFQSHDEPAPSLLDRNNSENLHNMSSQDSSGNIDLPRSIGMLEVIGEVEDKQSTNEEDRMLSLQEPSTEDLAAKWQAALAGDELLDDDALLGEDDMPENSAIDPAALFGSDDEGFLEDDDELIANQSSAKQQLSPLSGSAFGQDGRPASFDSPSSAETSLQNNVNSRYIPPNAAHIPAQKPSSTFTPSAPLFTDLSAQTSGNFSPTTSGYGSGTVVAPPSYGASQQRRPDAVKSQSFADKSKGGYSSPYDLPMEVVKPKKRASMQQMSRGYSNAPQANTIPPPRSSSMGTQGPPPPPSTGPASSISPPMASPSVHQPPVKSSQIPVNSPSLNSSGGFFAELPMVSRPKPSGRHTPQQHPPMHGDQGLQTMPQAYQPSQNLASQNIASVPGLVAPPKVSPFAPLPTSQPHAPVVTARYSPAPPPRSGSGSAPPPTVGGRYATAPPSQPQQSSSYASVAPASSPPAPILAHQPRTSSPLIHFETAPDQRSVSGSSTGAAHPSYLRRESSSLDQAPRAYLTQGRMSPSKRSTSNYAPDPRTSDIFQEPVFAPPQRSQTQSPGKVMTGSRADIGVGESVQRPVSVHSPTSPRQVNEHFSAMPTGINKPRMRGFSQGFNYIAPTDGREHDPLQRWRGSPIIAWGIGGTLITSFPKDVPRFGIGQSQPMIIRSPGEVKVRNIKEIYPLAERLAGFPGPLKGKSKKKDLLAWLTAGIDMIEQENSYLRSSSILTHDEKRQEERLLLWKILRVMIEHDGVLEGNPIIEKAVRGVLSPGFDGEDNPTVPQYSTGSDLTKSLRATTSTALPESVNPAAVDQLRQYLLRGEREKAVWEAVDKRLWAHALLISNTLSREVHKQVSQEFIQKEVKGVGENTESLAALYEIFAGNFEESVDELVPPSARAGLQMISTSATTGASKSSLDGLDRWRETLGLVLSNRSPDDVQAINALGKLLSGYGRAEAAHICFLFARGFSIFGGIDDPLSNMVLVGSDHLRQPYDFDKELEPTLLSEVYEYGLSLSGTSNVSFSAPHLAVYKFQHASILAQSGQRDKALQYCEAISSSITSQVRRSPYHHASLISALDDLSKRLKQSPKDESSSWITKPSIDKVSGSLWGKFNKFVAGDDDGVAGSEGRSELGPFARIAGDTPIISRSPSSGDIYNSLSTAPTNGSAVHLPVTKSTSRYAPGASYTSPSAQDSLLSNSHGSPPQAPYAQRRSQEGTMFHGTHAFEGTGYDHLGPNDQTSRSYPGSDSSLFSNSYGQSGSPSFVPQYQAPPMHDHHTSLGPPDFPRSVPISGGNESSMDYSPNPSRGFETTSGISYDNSSNRGDELPPSGGYEPPSSSGYEPPTIEGYEPPSYEPASMSNEPDSPIDTRPKKKSFMDDDDDYDQAPMTTSDSISKPAKVEKSKAEKDREADEAFRKAAEADAQKDASSAPTKKGWGLSGWFSKKEAAADGAQPNKPIKAKLGEESSFVYDPDLKRWVNKKAGKDDAQDGRSATPPPPRAGPPRSVSGAPVMEATSAPRPIGGLVPPQRAVSAMATSSKFGQSDGPPAPAFSPSLAIPMSRSISNGSGTGPPSGPPSRPTTSMSDASSIDDLLGPPTARKGGAKKAKKGRGYVDVMEKAGT